MIAKCLTLVFCLSTLTAFADDQYPVTADTTIRVLKELDRQVKSWKPGDEVPRRLLSFPEGRVPPLSLIHSDAYEDVFTARNLIGGIANDALLEEIIFDRRSERGAFEAAVITLIDRKGLPWFSKMLAKRDSTRWELQAFHEILQSPFARASVAFIGKDVMSRDEARRALEDIKSRLDKGQTWLAAYSAVADAHPDAERRKREPGSVSVLVTYLFSGWVSAHGFDFSSLQITPYVPAPYLADAIREGKGGKIVSAPDGLYLVYVFELYSPNTSSEPATLPLAHRATE